MMRILIAALCLAGVVSSGFSATPGNNEAIITYTIHKYPGFSFEFDGWSASLDAGFPGLILQEGGVISEDEDSITLQGTNSLWQFGTAFHLTLAFPPEAKYALWPSGLPALTYQIDYATWGGDSGSIGPTDMDQGGMYESICLYWGITLNDSGRMIWQTTNPSYTIFEGTDPAVILPKLKPSQWRLQESKPVQVVFRVTPNTTCQIKVTTDSPHLNSWSTEGTVTSDTNGVIVIERDVTSDAVFYVVE